MRERLAPAQASTWRHRHLLDVDVLTPEELELVMHTADVMQEVLEREVPRVPALRGITVVNLFYEPSTRTRISFELAAKALGADVINFAVEHSSVRKGESLLDTVRTIEALGAQILVMRHWQSGAPYLVARHTRMRVVNAGDGWHAHPTQALVDVYTLRRHLGDLRGRKVVIVGDIAHSRVARSNFWALTALGAQVIFCGPPTLMPPEAEKAFPGVKIVHDVDQAMEEADVVMALRLQRERMEGGLLPSLREYVRLYQVYAARLRPGALVMHPGPVNEGVELAPEMVYSPQSVIQEQVSNGVAVRMAVLYLLAGREEG